MCVATICMLLWFAAASGHLLWLLWMALLFPLVLIGISVLLAVVACVTYAVVVGIRLAGEVRA
jgi:hypothetical protein